MNATDLYIWAIGLLVLVSMTVSGLTQMPVPLLPDAAWWLPAG